MLISFPWAMYFPVDLALCLYSWPGTEEDEMNHADDADERLLAYAAGELDTALAADVTARLPASPEQAATVARYQAVQAILRADDSVAPPAAVIARAKAIFSAPEAATEAGPLHGLGDAMRQVMAELTFDSRGGLLAGLAGFRGAAATARQLVFEADGIVVDLHVEAPSDHEGRWQIMGQVDTDDLEHGLVVGLMPTGDGGAAVAVTTDAYGGFHLSAAAGEYNLFVRIADAVVVLPHLVIG